MNYLLEPLDIKIILSAIIPKNRNNISKLDVLDLIDSTNTFLLEKAKTGSSSGHFCLADQQTQGRGRQGKTWVSPPGANIYCSLFWRFAHLKQNLSGLSIAVGVMISKALSQYGIAEGIQLKWPNDILYQDKKLGGILLESNLPNTVVMGIGLNLFLDEKVPGAITLSEMVDPPLRRSYLMGLIMNELLEQLPVFEKQGLNVFLDEWKRKDGLINKKINVHVADKIIKGTMRGINGKGELVLETDGGKLQTFGYGEVSVKV